MVGDGGDADQDGDGQPCGDGADVVQPLADREADEIQERAERKPQQREDKKISSIFGKRLPARRPNEQRVARSKVKDCGIVGKIAGPIRPAGNESRKFAERTLAPDIKAAFLRVARRKFHHGKCEWKIKRTPCDQPDYDRACADGCRSSDPAQTDTRDDVEEHEIAKTHRTARADWS